MASLRTWLQLGRCHTASLTVPGTLLGCVASGHIEPLTLLAFGAWALLFHYIGFLHNNIADRPYDAADPSKAHFPLISGAININHARLVFQLGTFFLFISGITLALLWHATTLWSAVLWLFIAILNGISYNRSSKTHLSAPLTICLSFSALPVFAYFASGGLTANLTPTSLITYIFLYAFFLMLHQISWAGMLKDLGTDPVNLLRSFGATATPRTDIAPDAYHYHLPLSARAWGWGTRLACPLLAVAWMGSQISSFAIVWTVALLVTFALQVRGGLMLRSRKVLFMSLGEVSTYFLLITSLDPILAPWTVLWLILPLVYYAFFNTILWARVLAPRV